MSDRLPGRRDERLWVLLSVAVVTVVAVVEWISGVGIGVLLLGPLIAAIRVRPAATAAVAAYAVVLTLPLGAERGIFLEASHLVAIATVLGVGVLATVVSAIRTRLEAVQDRTVGLLARERFLADAGAVLDRSLNPDETLRQVASLAVPAFVAMCVIDLVDEDGTIRGVAVAAREPRVEAGMREMRTRFPLDPEGPHPVARVLRANEPLIIQLDEPTLQGLAASGEHLDFMRESNYRSAIVVPLRARNRTYGTISWLRFADQPPFDEPDLDLAEEVARRAALALSNAHLFNEAQHARQRSDEARAEASAARERAAFLAEAGVLLDQSLDEDTTLRDLARLAVPRLADWCAIDVPEPDGRLRNVVVVHRDAAKVALAERLNERYPNPPEGALGAPHVIRTGKPDFFPDIPDEAYERGAVDAEHVEILRGLDLRSGASVPLVARGRVLGAITLATEGERRLDEADLALAEDLATRAGLSVDNARLYGERARVAQTLQASLLPPQLPSVPHMRVAARYRPAAEGMEVGGDFYDVFGAGQDRWAFVVGDVCGKGAEAASLTALARYTLRAEAGRALPPTEVLARLNAAMLRQQEGGRFLTLAYVVLSDEADGPRLTVACAGHPPPVVVRGEGGSEELIGLPGSLLGVFDDPEFTERSTRLGERDSIVLYTDGATEGNPEHRIAPAELAAHLATHGGDPPDDLALEVERAAAGDGGPVVLRDDLAVLVAQRDPSA